MKLDGLHIIPVNPCKNTQEKSVIGPILQIEKPQVRKVKVLKSYPENIWLRVGSIVRAEETEHV